MSVRLRILGCGSSAGVPRIGGNWGFCDPTNPKNRRLRCSALIQRIGPHGRTTVLVDATPDVREQLLAAKIGQVDAVIFTHDHADHTHGIDDLRVLCYNARQRVETYYDAVTGESLLKRFGYCFVQPDDSPYPPILKGRELRVGEPLVIDGAGGALPLLPFWQEHGLIRSVGLRVADICYSPDVSDFPAASFPAFKDLGTWIIDALRPTPHPSHLTVEQALGWVAHFKPRRAVLTHMHIDLDYETLTAELPSGVEPAFDGMEIISTAPLDLPTLD